MVKIVIIGSGQLGSRHLQALSLLDRPALIFVVDPNEDSLKLAEKRFLEISNAGNRIVDVKYCSSIDKIPNHIDLAIISTNSDIRRAIIENLLNCCRVNYLILEKVLFQKINDFAYIDNLLKAKNVQAWVNCPRRMMNFYKELKCKLATESLFEINIFGSNWGLATSSIHMIDLISFLSNSTEYKITNTNIDDEPKESKRKGFYELTGAIDGFFNDSIKFKISSFYKGNVPYTIQIISDKSILYIRAVEGKYWIGEEKTNWKLEEVSFTFPFQSQLTHLAVQQILNTSQCSLTSYDESIKLHIPLLECFGDYFNKMGYSSNFCPIT